MAAKKIKSRNAKRGTRRSSLKQRRKKQNVSYVFLWSKRIGIIAGAVVLVGWLGAWIVLSDIDKVSIDWARETIIKTSTKAGFRVNNILVEGRVHTDSDALRGIINVQKGDSIFLFHPDEAKTQIEKIGWIKSARVERRLPDTVYINLVERKPMALWHNKDVLQLIDSEGEVLTQQNLEQFKDLPMIRGEGAPPKSIDLFTILDSEPELFSRLDHAELVDRRRWNLYLKSGARIKLPEEGAATAIRHVMLRQDQDNILSKEMITVIDARYAGRLIVRTKLGKVQDYKAEIIHTGTSL